MRSLIEGNHRCLLCVPADRHASHCYRAASAGPWPRPGLVGTRPAKVALPRVGVGRAVGSVASQSPKGLPVSLLFP